MRTYFGLASFGLVFAAFCGAALTWDGSGYLYQLLDAQAPIIAHGRYITIPLHWPTIIAAQFTTNLAFLQTIFGLVYTSLPLLSLALCWWIVRERAPQLFVWPVVGIGLAMLPGQFFFVAEANIAIYLFWPIFLAVLMGMQATQVPVVITLMIALLLTHPFAILLFLLAALVSLLVGRQSAETQRKTWVWVAVFTALALVGVAQLAFFSDGYESDQLSLGLLSYAFGSSVVGLPLVALVFTWIASLAIAFAPVVERRQGLGAARGVAMAGTACVVLAGIVLVAWARDVNLWRTALDFRYVTLFNSLPFLGLALYEGLRSAPEYLARIGAGWERRIRTMHVVAAVSTLVLVTQSVAWFNLTNRLRDTIAQSPWTCVSTAPLSWVQQSPLSHWSVATTGLLLQGQSPDKIVLSEDGCGQVDTVDSLRLTSWLAPRWEGGWFDFTQLRTNLLGEIEYPRGCSYALSTGWYQTETDGPYWWRWSDGRASQMRVLTEKELPAALSGQIETLRAPNQIDVIVNGTPQTTIDLPETGLQTLAPIEIALLNGKNTIQFVSRNPPTQEHGRELGLSVANIVLASGDLSTVCRFHP